MNEFLERREVGRTGMQTARLGIGSTFGAPASAIEEAFERGINYLYWGTVRRPEFAHAMVNLSRQHRDELILTIQSYSKNPESIAGEVEEALTSAGVEYFDFLLLGNRGEVPEDAYLDVFERLRERGKVRFVSISSHNRPMLPKLLAGYRGRREPLRTADAALQRGASGRGAGRVSVRAGGRANSAGRGLHGDALATPAGPGQDAAGREAGSGARLLPVLAFPSRGRHGAVRAGQHGADARSDARAGAGVRWKRTSGSV